MGGEILCRSAHQAQRRAIVKTVCYRLFMVLITVVVAWLVVGDATAALNIGIATNVVKTVTYYLYERLWDHVSWGVTAPA